MLSALFIVGITFIAIILTMIMAGLVVWLMFSDSSPLPDIGWVRLIAGVLIMWIYISLLFYSHNLLCNFPLYRCGIYS